MFISKNSLRQGMSIFPSCLVNLCFGFVFGWVAPAVEHFQSEEAPFVVSNDELSWIASVYFGAEVLSSAFNGLFTQKLGRRPMLIFSSFLVATAWLVQILANSSTMVILSRAMHGVAAGTHDVVWCMYIGEVTSPVERGVYGTLMMSAFQGGIMMQFFLSLYVPYLYLSIIPFVISTVAFTMKCFIKETPQYLIKRGKLEAAICNLAWLRGTDDPKLVQTEFEEMKKYVEEEANTGCGITRVLTSPSKHKVVLVGILIFTLAQPSGNVAILSFQTLLLDRFENFSAGANLTMIYGLLQFAFINLAPILMEKIGRKKPMIIGFLISAFIHALLSYLFYIAESQKTSDKLPYIICALFNLYGVVFVLTILPTVYVLKSELFPHDLKSFANCSATMTNALVEFVVVKLFVFIWLTFGLHVNFVFYACINIVSVAYVYALIPETKGKTLVEIQVKIQSKNEKKKSVSEGC